jgi:hypothetical protein
MCWILNLESGVMRNATGYNATAYSYIEILAEPRRLEFRMDVECWTFECLNLESSSLQNRNSQQVTGDMSIVKLQQVRTLNISTLNFWTLDTWNLKLETWNLKHISIYILSFKLGQIFTATRVRTNVATRNVAGPTRASTFQPFMPSYVIHHTIYSGSANWMTQGTAKHETKTWRNKGTRNKEQAADPSCPSVA